MSAVLEQSPVYRLDDIIQKFVELRDQKEALQNSVKAQIQGIDEQLKTLTGYLMLKMQESGQDAVKTAYGTAFKKESDFVSVSNWDDTLAYIRANGAWSMLNKAVNKTAVKEYIEQNEVPPPGINYTRIVEVQVRRK